MDGLYEEYDEALKKIQKTCFEYMTDKTIINNYTYVELISMEACLISMKEDLMKLSNSMQTAEHCDHFSDIYKTLCKITLSDSVNSSALYNSKGVLGNIVCLLLRNINMCFGIIKQMLLKVAS